MGKLNYKVGEVKYATITIIPIEKDDPFTIYDTSWILYKNGEAVQSGDECAVEGHEISVLLHANEKGLFTLEFTYHIAAETLKKDVTIEVE